jgi:hypothetical protein
MNRQELIKDMKSTIGTREPTVYFDKMTDLFTMMFDKIDRLEAELHRVKTNSALAIQWEPRVAADMLSREITKLKKLDKETYAFEIIDLQRAYGEDRVTQEYTSFCQFWQDTLGWHPFLDYTG